MSNLTVNGVVTVILKPESGTSKAGKEWNKQDFVIKTGDKYPVNNCFTLFGDKTKLLSDIKLGDEVDVSFNMDSREWEGRWFTNVNAWKIELISPADRDNTHTESKGDLPPEFENNPPADDGDLPF
jgi:hypothetical protein